MLLSPHSSCMLFPTVPKPLLGLPWYPSKGLGLFGTTEASTSTLLYLVTLFPLSSQPHSSSLYNVSFLLALTNHALISTAKISFKVIEISKPLKCWKPKTDPGVRALSIQIYMIWSTIKASDHTARQELLPNVQNSHINTPEIITLNVYSRKVLR